MKITSSMVFPLFINLLGLRTIVEKRDILNLKKPMINASKLENVSDTAKSWYLQIDLTVSAKIKPMWVGGT